MKRYLLGFTAIVSAGLALPAQGAVLGQAGDADCFGLGGSCPAGTLWRDDLGGTFFTDYSGPGDPLGTDVWTGAESPSFSIDFAGGTDVSLFFKVAGIADNGRGPHGVLVNGVAVGLIPTLNTGDAFQLVRDFTFVVPDLLLNVGSNTISLAFTNPNGDGYALDYFQLNGTALGGVVPEPATWAMMIGGFGLAGGALRNRRRRTSVRFA